MKLIIINGLPGTGKTTIAKPLAEQLGFPLVSKDTIKEFLFDTIGVGDREWSKTLGKVSSEFLYSLADELLSKGHSVIIESAFEPIYAQPNIQKYIDLYHPEVFEIYCTTEKEVRRKRFEERNESGLRHAGHQDHTNYLSEDDEEPTNKFAPINIGLLKKIDTTHDHTDIDELIDWIKND